MHTLHPYSIFHLGDSALTIDFGNVIGEEINQKVLLLFHHLKKLQLPFITGLVPAYSSLAVFYDVTSVRRMYPGQTAFDSLSDIINDMRVNLEGTIVVPSRTIEVPVCYSMKFAPDAGMITELKNISLKEIIELHTSRTYRVYMLGFLPGFAYMGVVDERLATPRKETPRTMVAAGSVGIAGNQTGIYPMDSPGGWQIIGRTPMLLFDKEKEQPVLFEPGDEIKFYSISEDEFANYQGGHS